MSSSFLNPTVSVLSTATKIAGSACMACERSWSVFVAKSLPIGLPHAFSPRSNVRVQMYDRRNEVETPANSQSPNPENTKSVALALFFGSLKSPPNKLSRVGNRPSNLVPRKPKSSFGCRPWKPRHLRRDNPRSPWRFKASAWCPGFNLVADRELPDSSKTDDLELRPTFGLLVEGHVSPGVNSQYPLSSNSHAPHRCQNQTHA